MSVDTSSLTRMDVVDAAAVVLAALEVAPAEPEDLTPLVRDREDLQALVGAPGEVGDLPLAKYLASTIDPRRVAHWVHLLRHDVSEARRYSPVLAGQPGYPSRLGQVWDAPPLLFVRGVLADDSVPAVAIIGSRTADEAAVRATNDVAFALAASGVDVVSGLALGIDCAAHRGALRADRHTTAVMGTGIEVVFPTQHNQLAESVSRVGALVSEFPPYAPQTGTSFLRRNGTIAAMSDVVVVMHAAAVSGSRQAVRRAVEYGRPVMMWEPTLGREEWARDLVESGQAELFSDPCRVLFALQGIGQ